MTPAARRKYNRQYYIKHRIKLLLAEKSRRQNDKIAAQEKGRKYRAKYPDKIKAAIKKCQLEHKVEYTITRKKWLQEHSESVKDIKRKSRYGISAAEYRQMLKDQNRKCKICGKQIKLVIDHNHKTGKVRGLLCARCNHMLGHARDNPLILRAGAIYLENY